MDFEKALSFVETYSREYLLYLLDFFRRKQGDTKTGVEHPEGKIVVYAMISASIGLFLSYKFVSDTQLTQDAFAVELFAKFAYWLAIALVLHVLLILTGVRPEFMTSLLITLTVMPVAYALGGYAAYLANKLSWLWVDPEKAKYAYRGYAYFGAVIAQLGIALVYFPRMVSRMTNATRAQIGASCAGVSTFIVIVQLIALIGRLESHAK